VLFKKAHKIFNKSFFLNNNPTYVNKLANLLNTNPLQLFDAKLDTQYFDFIENLTTSKTLRFSNYLTLRSPIRNSIVTYNAIQKVFRSRFDEGRSNAKLLDYGMSHMRQPLINSSRLKYEKLLSKNKEAFLDLNFYKTQNINSFSSFYNFFNSLNFYFFDFPFLLALKSDASRYL